VRFVSTRASSIVLYWTFDVVERSLESSSGRLCGEARDSTLSAAELLAMVARCMPCSSSTTSPKKRVLGRHRQVYKEKRKLALMTKKEIRLPSDHPDSGDANHGHDDTKHDIGDKIWRWRHARG
jgi:hypothetical protein